jgi:hypothetical protein
MLPFASYTDGWGTHAFSDGNRTLWFMGELTGVPLEPMPGKE